MDTVSASVTETGHEETVSLTGHVSLTYPTESVGTRAVLGCAAGPAGASSYAAARSGRGRRTTTPAPGAGADSKSRSGCAGAGERTGRAGSHPSAPCRRCGWRAAAPDWPSPAQNAGGRHRPRERCPAGACRCHRAPSPLGHSTSPSEAPTGASGDARGSRRRRRWEPRPRTCKRAAGEAFQPSLSHTGRRHRRATPCAISRAALAWVRGPPCTHHTTRRPLAMAVCSHSTRGPRRLECLSSRWTPSTRRSRVPCSWCSWARWAATFWKRWTVLMSTLQMLAVPASPPPSADTAAAAPPSLPAAWSPPSTCPGAQSTLADSACRATARCACPGQSTSGARCCLPHADLARDSADEDTPIC
jgi:hypothetical protein